MAEKKKVVIIGDGPTGLSAALFLAKNGLDVDLFGGRKTPVKKALLKNLLARDNLPGPDFLEQARRHAQEYGARLHDDMVERVEDGPPFRVITASGEKKADFLVLATGFNDAPVGELSLETDETCIAVDRNGRTSHDAVYAGGGVTRGDKSQVAISVGDGAAIAVDIISKVKGEPTHDWDVLTATH